MQSNRIALVFPVDDAVRLIRSSLCLSLVCLVMTNRVAAQDASPADQPNAVPATPSETAPAETPPAPSTAADVPPADAAPPVDLPPVAATIDGDPIFVGEVENVIELAKKAGKLPQGDVDLLKATLLKQLVDRRLAAHQVARDESLVKSEEVAAKLRASEAQVRKFAGTGQIGKSFEEIMRSKGVTSELFRQDAILQVYLDRHLADALEGFFNEHRQEFDGTELRASQILLRAERFDEKPAQTEARAAKLREEISAGKIDFASAAKKYSVAPSRDQGGDVGFVPRQGVMLEGFSAALFKLKKGEIAPPVSTPFGTHLITVTDVKPGDRQWTQVIPQIRVRAEENLISELADKERASAKIEYTGLAPYFKSGTQEVVKAKP